MKKSIIRYGLFFLISVYPLISFNQNWLPLDKGVGSSLTRMFADTNTNLLYVNGVFTANSENIFGGVAKWDGITWDTLPNCQVFPNKFIVFKYLDTLYISGFFSNIPIHGSNIAKWNGSIFDTITGTTDMNIYCTVEKNGILYLGGAFKKCGIDSAYSLCKYDGHHFTAITPNYEGNAHILCMAFYKDTLYVGGNFGLYSDPSIASFAKWDGAGLLSVSDQFSNVNCTIETMAVYKDELYVSGAFRKSDGFTGDYIMKWDGHQFTEVGGGTNQRVTCMKVYNNELYVGGWFTTVGNVECDNVAKWDGTQWVCLNHDAFDFTFSLRDLSFLNDRLYIAGMFDKIGNDSIHNIAMYNNPLNSVHENQDMLTTTNYPNPFTDYTNLIFSKPLNEATLQVFDILGKEVMRMENLKGKEIRISRNGISKGMYFFRVVEGNINVGKGKMIVE
jgi:hypothetical protein